MPVTFKVCDVKPVSDVPLPPAPAPGPAPARRPSRAALVQPQQPPGTVLSAGGLLSAVRGSKPGDSPETVLQTSYQPSENYCFNANGFIGAVVQAYNAHLNLAIRPDDLWIAILSQFSAHINAHAEEFRETFVSHTGTKTLVIESETTHPDFGKMTRDMAALLKENINDPTLYEYIMPEFSTTHPHDSVTCATLMMATLKAYFKYEYHIRCGIPNITLLGEKEDYESILNKLDRLATFSAECAIFARLLRPILKQFVAVFDGPPDLEFWTRICHYKMGGSGPSFVGGWITAFCAWSSKGEWIGHPLATFDAPLTDEEKERLTQEQNSRAIWPLVYDGVRYHLINTGQIPEGVCEVPVTLVIAGTAYDCMLTAGHTGYVKRKATVEEAASSGDDGTKQNTLQPSPEWIFFSKEDAKVPI